MSVILKLKAIEKAVCKHFKITADELFTRSNKRAIVEKRQIFHYLARTYTNERLRVIAGHHGVNYRHCTVLHSVNHIKDLIFWEPKFRATIDLITIELFEDAIRNDKELTDLHLRTKELMTELLQCDSQQVFKDTLSKYL